MSDRSIDQGVTDFSREHRTEVEPAQPRAGALERSFPDPGLPPHVYRSTDVDPKAARAAERQVALLFGLSVLGTVLFVVAFFAIDVSGARLDRVKLSTTLLGTGLAVALLGIGIGAIHWAKKLMPDDEVVEERHPIRSTDEERAAGAAVILDGGAAAGLPRRKLITGSLFAALAALPAMAVVPLWGLWSRDRGKSPAEQLSHTAWAPGVRLVRDPTGQPIRPAEMPLGGVLHVLPGVESHGEPTGEGEHSGLTLNEIAKAAVLLIRVEPDALRPPTRLDWTYAGIVAYSKICTHVGCPVGLYEQTTHHLLCPCHQSTFAVDEGAKVIFGPAGHPLPQLALALDQEGYLVAQHDFTEPVGPSFWERG